MKTLASEFTKKGFTHKLIERTGNVAIYERTKPHYSRSHFEVIRVRLCPAHDWGGKHFEASEVYPSSEHWGKLGFTCSDLTSAKALAATLGHVPRIKTCKTVTRITKEWHWLDAWDRD